MDGIADMDKFYNCEERIKLAKLLIRLYMFQKHGYIKMKNDFDDLKHLFIDDPDEFYRVTQAMINEVLDSCQDDKREIMRAKQWRLEQTLAKVKDPLERMNRMVALFWEGVPRLSNTINGIESAKPVKSSPKTNAKIIDIIKKT